MNVLLKDQKSVHANIEKEIQTEVNSSNSNFDELKLRKNQNSLNKDKKFATSKARKISIENDSSDSDTDDKDNEESEDEDDLHKSSIRQTKFRSCKLPPFSGKEMWEVWFNRFESVADRRNWSKDDRLDELLPRLQGEAGEFVYSQLTAKTRSSYKRLTSELGNRFKQIEISKSFQAQFSKRNQKPNESVKTYANELKRLYDKGHSSRPLAIRQEDLLRRFLDGLADRKVAQQIEFVKEPKTVEEAVVEVVTYQDSAKRNKYDSHSDKNVYMVRPANDSDDESDSDELDSKERVARVPDKNSTKNKTNATQGPHDNVSNMQEQLKLVAEQQKVLLDKIQTINQRDNKINSVTDSSQKKQPSSYNHSYAQGQTRNRYDNRANGQKRSQVDKSCYNCRMFGHFSRNCPYKEYSFSNPQMNHYQNQTANSYQYVPNVQNPMSSVMQSQTPPPRSSTSARGETSAGPNLNHNNQGNQ